MILQINNLSKSFGGIRAIHNVSLGIEKNEAHAIVGPNGAGKTTLISQLSGVLKPDHGEIVFNGKEITHAAASKRAHLGLARSFQVTSVILAMTVVENVMLSVQSITGHSFRFWSPAVEEPGLLDQARLHLSEVGLEARENTVASELSHGEQRQLELAMALALKPKMLLLDEPTAGMSKEETGKMIELLAGFDGKVSMLLVEHDMDAVFRLARRTSVLVGGEIIASDETDAIRRNPDVQKAYLGDS